MAYTPDYIVNSGAVSDTPFSAANKINANLDLIQSELAAVETSITATSGSIAAVNSAVNSHSSAASPHSGHENKSAKNQSNGYCGLDASGKVPTSQLPGIAVGNSFPVASQSEMLALAAVPGDIAIRIDLNKCFILHGSDPAVLANWLELLTPSGAVQSVDGRTGVVSLSDLYAGITHGHSHGDITDWASAVMATLIYGSAAGTVCQGNDSRLSDARAPLAHNQAASTILPGTFSGTKDQMYVFPAGILAGARAEGLGGGSIALAAPSAGDYSYWVTVHRAT